MNPVSAARLSTPLWDSPPVGASVTIAQILDEYLSQRNAAPRYAESLRRTTRKIGLYSIIHLCQLTPQIVNQFLRAVPVGQTTKANYRREILTLWRYAYESGATDVPPRGVMKVKAPRQSPEAWSLSELSKMLSAATKDRTPISQRAPWMRRCDVIPAWIFLGYESGLRLADLLSLQAGNFRNGCVVVCANKTGKSTIRGLSNRAESLCRSLLDKSPDGSLFSWVLPRRRAILMWKDFLEAHGFRGSSKWLRRSGATALENEHPGMATRWLDHSAPHLARLHYVDATLLSPPIGPPPFC